MIRLYFFCFFILFKPCNHFAQIVAGEVPLGYTVHTSDFSLQEDNYIITLDLIDLNFDGANDLSFQIEKEENGSNKASVFSRMDSLEICHLQGLNFTPTVFYAEGESMECVDSAGFDLNPALVGMGLGRYNNGPVGNIPSQLIHGYLHYEWKYGSDPFEGWIKLSFDLTQDTISLQVHEWIIKDEVTFTKEEDVDRGLICYPNPVGAGILNLNPDYQFESFKLYNVHGALLKAGVNHDHSILVDDLKGMIILELRTGDNTMIERVIIL